MSHESHDYSEIYTPSKEQPTWDQEMTSVTASGASGAESMSGSSSVRTGSGDSGLSGANCAVKVIFAPNNSQTIINNGKHRQQQF